MACVLRAYGESFAPDDFVAHSDLGPAAVWYKGQSRVRSRAPPSNSGFNVLVGGGEDFPSQVEDAIRFLDDHRRELAVLRQTPGLEGLVLDFGVADREATARFDFLPPALIRLAAEFGMGIEVSHYRTRDDGPVG